MAKVNIEYQINNVIKKTNGVLNNNKLSFKDDDIMFNITFSNDYIKLNRHNDEYELLIELGDKNICICTLKEHGSINMNVELVSIDINKDIFVKYKLENQLFELMIKYEVIE